MTTSIFRMLRTSAEVINSIRTYYPSSYNISRLSMINFVLEEYFKNNIDDWKKYTNYKDMNDNGYYKHDFKKTYNDINVNLDCSIITWSPYSQTQIHNHPNKSCLMMPIKGILHQNIFYNTLSSDIILPNSRGINIKPGVTSYIDDNIGIHRLSNNSEGYAVSIHLYEDLNDINTYNNN